MSAVFVSNFPKRKRNLVAKAIQLSGLALVIGEATYPQKTLNRMTPLQIEISLREHRKKYFAVYQITEDSPEDHKYENKFSWEEDEGPLPKGTNPFWRQYYTLTGETDLRNHFL